MFKKIDNNNHISVLKSSRLSDESIKHPAAFNNSLAPELNHINIKLPATFDGLV